MTKSVILIGGGVAGLCTGSYASANGYTPIIFEANSTPGGLCTAWPKDGYTIDFCLHWLTGAAGANYDLYQDWKFLGVIDQLEYIFPTDFTRFIGINGQELALGTNLEKLERDLLALAPEDAREIKQMMRAIRGFAKYDLGLEIPKNWFRKLVCAGKMVPILTHLMRYSKLTQAEFGAQFKNPFLAQAFGSSWDPKISAIIILLLLAWGSKGIFGYPIGGSGAFARALEKRYLELGGAIHYNTPVHRILVDNNHAVGVELANGDKHYADYVISAADGHETVFELLDGAYVDQETHTRYREWPIMGPLLFIAYGINKTFPGLPAQLSTTCIQIPTIKIGDREQEWLQVKIYTHDPTLAPAGKTLVTVLLESEYDFWEALSHDKVQYQSTKEQIARQVAELIDRTYPGFSAHIDMTEIVTPTTIHHWTHNWQGSYEGWLPTPSILLTPIKKTLPGLENFYMVGHWVQPGGGLPSCAMTAKEVVRMICTRDNKRFTGS